MDELIKKNAKEISFMLWHLMMTAASVFGQHVKPDTTIRKCFIGSTFFMLDNFSSTNKPGFVQLNLGYRTTRKGAVSIELKTWKYAWPLGIPCGKSFEAPEEAFPGYIREYGIALAFQHFWWKGLYNAVQCNECTAGILQ